MFNEGIATKNIIYSTSIVGMRHHAGSTTKTPFLIGLRDRMFLFVYIYCTRDERKMLRKYALLLARASWEPVPCYLFSYTIVPVPRLDGNVQETSTFGRKFTEFPEPIYSSCR